MVLKWKLASHGYSLSIKNKHLNGDQMKIQMLMSKAKLNMARVSDEETNQDD